MSPGSWLTLPCTGARNAAACGDHGPQVAQAIGSALRELPVGRLLLGATFLRSQPGMPARWCAGVFVGDPATGTVTAAPRVGTQLGPAPVSDLPGLGPTLLLHAADPSAHRTVQPRDDRNDARVRVRTLLHLAPDLAAAQPSSRRLAALCADLAAEGGWAVTGRGRSAETRPGWLKSMAGGVDTAAVGLCWRGAAEGGGGRGLGLAGGGHEKRQGR